jgi:Ca2+-binding EF-hand superfamily protein
MANDPGPNGTGPRPNRVKKSETLEVRIPYETKQAFLTACREDGTTASEVVRDKVQDYLDARERPSLNAEKRTLIMKLPQPIRHYGWRAAAGGVAAIGFVGLAALPSAAAPDFKAQFGRLDKNGDGVISVEEFLDMGPGADSKEARNVVIESRVTTSTDDGAAKPEISGTAELKRDAFTFWLPEELGGKPPAAGAGPAQQHQEYKFIGRHETKDGEAGATASHTVTFSMDDMRKDEFAEIDTDKDGKISLQEYQTRQTAMLTRGFEILDANDDKALSEDEYAKIVAPPMIRVNWAGPGAAGAPEIPPVEIPGMKAADPAAIKAAFTRLDANKDGKLSLQEYLPVA